LIEFILKSVAPEQLNALPAFLVRAFATAFAQVPQQQRLAVTAVSIQEQYFVTRRITIYEGCEGIDCIGPICKKGKVLIARPTHVAPPRTQRLIGISGWGKPVANKPTQSIYAIMSSYHLPSDLLSSGA